MNQDLHAPEFSSTVSDESPLTTSETAHFESPTLDIESASDTASDSDHSVDETPATPSAFLTFNLRAEVLNAVQRLGFDQPTPVQALSLPAGLSGTNLMVSSQTGSGKTLAFLIPAVQRLLDQAEQSVRIGRFDRLVARPQVLVLCPTRELSQQVAQDAIKLVRPIRGIRVASVTGGVPFGRQLQTLRGANLVVATPGRLLDLASNGQIGLDQVSLLVLDEADRMLDLGFQEDLEAIHAATTTRDQTLMFSATFAGPVEKLAGTMMPDPLRLDSAGGDTTNADIEQTLHWTDGYEHKFKLLEHWLTQQDLEQAVVFASTQQDTDDLANQLSEAGHSVVALHGAMPQGVRNQRIRSLRSGQARVLVATDVAARGLDVPGITHVINFGLPMKNEDYVHRIGRTGRAGRKGRAITLAMQRERRKIRALEDYLTQSLPVSEIEGLEPRPFTPGPRRPGRSYHDRGGRARPGQPQGEGRRRDYREGRPERANSGESRFDARPPRSYENRPPREPRPARSHDNQNQGNFEHQQPAYNRNQFSWEREGQSTDRRGPRPGQGQPRRDGGAPANRGGRPNGRSNQGAGQRPYRNDEAYHQAFESRSDSSSAPARRFDRRDDKPANAPRRSFSGKSVFRKRDED